MEHEIEEESEEEDNLTLVDLIARNPLHMAADDKTHHCENLCTILAEALVIVEN